MNIKNLCYLLLLCAFSISNANAADVLGGSWITKNITDPLDREIIKPILKETNKMTDPRTYLCGGVKSSACKKAMGMLNDKLNSELKTTAGKIALAALRDLPKCRLKEALKSTGVISNDCSDKANHWLMRDESGEEASQGQTEKMTKKTKEEIIKIKTKLINYTEKIAQSRATDGMAFCVKNLKHNWSLIIDSFGCGGYHTGQYLYEACRDIPYGYADLRRQWAGLCLGVANRSQDLKSYDADCQVGTMLDKKSADKLAVKTCSAFIFE